MVVGASALFWASRDYTVVAPDWDGQVRGIAYNPSHLFTDRQAKTHHAGADRPRPAPSCRKITGHIRTYTVDGGMDKVPEIARRYGMTVSLGIWIRRRPGQERAANRTGHQDGAGQPPRHRPRDRGQRDPAARRRLARPAQRLYPTASARRLPARIKITTAEPWSTWMLTPEVGQHVDVIFVHLLPYWENVRHPRRAQDRDRLLRPSCRQTFPDKPIVIGEAGWPSDGRTRGAGRGLASPTRPISCAPSCSTPGKGLGLLSAGSL